MDFKSKSYFASDAKNYKHFYDKVSTNGFAVRLIKSIKVKCKQYKSGCKWTETISNYPVSR